jgi:ankyrin repeat protein
MGVAESRNDRFYQLCGLGKTHLVEKMLEADKQLKTININWQNYESKCTPLLIASANGHVKVVEILISQNAEVTLKDEREATALHHAAQSGHLSIIDILLKAGCDINAVDKNQWTPLMNACYWANEDAAYNLLDAGANSELRNIDGRTALHEVCRSPAVNKGKILARIAKRLIQAGCDANVSSTSEEDLNALMYAAYHNHVSVANVLIEHNCNIDSTDYQGWSALHWSADRDHIDIVKLLVQRGCKLNLKGKREESALDRAKSDLVRDFISQHLPCEKIAVENIIMNGFHNGHNGHVILNGHHNGVIHNGIVDSSINAN